MSANYYVRYDKCECCGRYDKLHIGKQSVGWTFLFRSYRELELHSAGQWRELLNKKGSSILDEYGVTITPEDFFAKVEAAQTAVNKRYVGWYSYLDKENFAFSAEEFS